MRIAAALFIAAHGVGYVIWFMAAWAPSLLGTEASNLGGLERLFGVLALVVLAGFLAAAYGVWQQEAWWPGVLVTSILLAIPTAFTVWNPIGNVSVMAEMANVGLLAATIMPWGDRILGAH